MRKLCSNAQIKILFLMYTTSLSPPPSLSHDYNAGLKELKKILIISIWLRCNHYKDVICIHIFIAAGFIYGTFLGLLNVNAITPWVLDSFQERTQKKRERLSVTNEIVIFSLRFLGIAFVMIIIILSQVLISNSNWTEWSTIQGVIGRVISNRWNYEPELYDMKSSY